MIAATLAGPDQGGHGSPAMHTELNFAYNVTNLSGELTTYYAVVNEGNILSAEEIIKAGEDASKGISIPTNSGIIVAGKDVPGKITPSMNVKFKADTKLNPGSTFMEGALVYFVSIDKYGNISPSESGNKYIKIKKAP